MSNPSIELSDLSRASPSIEGIEQQRRTSSTEHILPLTNLDSLPPNTQKVRAPNPIPRRLFVWQVVLALGVVVLNTSFTIWARVRHPPQVECNNYWNGTFYAGDCDYVSKLNIISHLVINLLSAAFLATGNYCMQVLVSPSKAELKRIHSEGKSLEIGVHSPRNLLRLHWMNAVLWSLLGFFSIVLQLLWNSAIFTTIPVAAYPIVGITSDWPTAGLDWENQRGAGIAAYGDHLSRMWANESGRPSIYQIPEHIASFTKVDVSACIANFIDPLTATNEVALVLNVTSEQFQGSSLVFGDIRGIPTARWFDAQNWICSYYYERFETNPDSNRFCNLEWARSFRNNWTVQWSFNTSISTVDTDAGAPSNVEGNTTRRNFNVEYCLISDPGNQGVRCSFQYNQGLLFAVCACNFVILFLVCSVVSAYRKSPLLVIGDVVSECLQENADIVPAAHQQESKIPIELTSARWPRRRIYWLAAISIHSWIICMFWMMAGLSVGFYFYGASVRSLSRSHVSTSPHSLWALGFGQPSGYTLVPRLTGWFASGPASLQRLVQTHVFYANVLFANSFQLLINFEYMFVNNILTRQLIAAELIRYFSKAKRLRVSDPQSTSPLSTPPQWLLWHEFKQTWRRFHSKIKRKVLRKPAENDDQQRPTLFLSLPWTIAIPLMLSFALLNWLVSLGSFVVQLHSYGPGSAGIPMQEFDASRAGYSPIAILLACIVWLVILVALLANSFRKYGLAQAGFLRLACNSHALALLCSPVHPQTHRNLRELRLGVVQRQPGADGISGRICFGTETEVMAPHSYELYEQPVWVKGKEKKLQLIATNARNSRPDFQGQMCY